MSLSPPSEKPQKGSDQHDAEASSEAQDSQCRSNAPNVRKEDGQECDPNPDRDGYLSNDSRSVDVRSLSHADHFSASGGLRGNTHLMPER
jgi:hypothetical protein